MEKVMRLVAASEKKSTTFTRRDGTTANYSWYEVTLTDGKDTIVGETTESLTREIDSMPEDHAFMQIGWLYSISASFQVRVAKRDNVETKFLKCNIQSMYSLYAS